MPGPAPDMNALRRERKDDKATWALLPVAGREGEPPAWPIPDPSERELALWAELWKLPQAVEWERGRYALSVADYVRARRIAESPMAQAPERALVLRMAVALGLNEEGLRRNRWKIEDATVEPARPAIANKERAARKARLRSIEGGAA